MAALNVVVRYHRPNKKNTYKVEISVHHNRHTCYIDTGMSVADALSFVDGTFTKKKKDYINCNFQLSSLLGKWQVAIDRVVNKDDLSCQELIETAKVHLDRGEGVITLQDASNEFIELKISEGKLNHAEYTRWAIDKLCEMLKGDVRLCDISMHMIAEFSLYMKKKGYSDAYVSSTLARIKAVVNYARNYGYVRYDSNPFALVKISAARVRDCAVDVDDIMRYSQAHLTMKKDIVARDIWMLSFYLAGANYKDIVEGKFNGNEFIYIRSKTADRVNDVIRIPILPGARAIIDKYIQKDGSLDFGYKFTNYSNHLRFVASSYRDIKKSIGLPDSFSYMSARKSFAQFASELGVPDGVIDYCLGHSLNKGGILRYYRRVTTRQARAAMERVFDYVDNPGKYDDALSMFN